MEPRILGHMNPIVPSFKDFGILKKRSDARKGFDTPIVGDFIRFSDGVIHRFSHKRGDGLQTSNGGSFYMGDTFANFSGGLDPVLPYDNIFPTEETRLGHFWFFHDDWATAHNGIDVLAYCRVWESDLPSNHWRKK